jgi:hypothetical protein
MVHVTFAVIGTHTGLSEEQLVDNNVVGVNFELR